MLSAPGPPDGSSPTPVPPELPLVMEPRPSTAGTVGVASADRHEVAGGMQQVSPLDVICPMSMPSDGVGVGLLGGGASSIKGGVLNGVGTMKAETGELKMKRKIILIVGDVCLKGLDRGSIREWSGHWKKPQKEGLGTGTPPPPGRVSVDGRPSL